MAVGKIPPPENIETILSRKPRPFFLAAVDGLTNAENLGVLVRNCAAFGVQALLVGETSSSPYLRRAVRNSMGAVFRLPVVPVTRLADTLQGLRRNHGVFCVAAHPRASSIPLTDTDLARDCCLVFGSEGEGISAGVLAACDQAVGIPMLNGVDSLNVASASAVFFHAVTAARRSSRA
jgi:tRNA G18 (ribose-2'-O)-methylase SpoU